MGWARGGSVLELYHSRRVRCAMGDSSLNFALGKEMVGYHHVSTRRTTDIVFQGLAVQWYEKNKQQGVRSSQEEASLNQLQEPPTPVAVSSLVVDAGRSKGDLEVDTDESCSRVFHGRRDPQRSNRQWTLSPLALPPTLAMTALARAVRLEAVP